MMTASSPPKSTRSVIFTGYLIASSGPVTDVDGLRNSTGSVACSPFSSGACAG